MSNNKWRWTVPTTELPHQSIMHPVSPPPLHLPLLPSTSKKHTERNPCAILLAKAKNHVHWCLTAWWPMLPSPNQNLGSRESHFELIITGSNFHHSTTPAGHLIAKLERIWGVLEPTCGSHMTGLGGARTASDDQGRLGWQWWPPKTVQPAVTRAGLPGPDPA